MPKKTVLNPKTDGNEYLFPVDQEEIDEQLEEATGIRHIDIDGSKFVINSTDPYGLWNIKTKGGRLPEVLSGMYTTAGEAEQAIEAYLKAKQAN